ncbi:PQQ-binding-like beta-propeller repeat protein [Fuerstiella marisgermanici]|uniref:Outer membrane biogenesis protein n=1 Tax=Fuerstiella marisgermanici TaxID=1891926 RepID=A0A1P8WPT3_9PLAN|nr:PQQ-binding-like beta-propeller repeat protein [Fuerstiella marisgermanici]APZ96045.1 outer membrane biogenesis protein [Fuerstiella marisgermanici]
MRNFFLHAAIVVFVIGSPADADNWTHWRGDDGNGVSRTANPPTEWSDTKNVKWKVRIPGQGSGTPVIWEDKVYVVSAVATDLPDEQPDDGGAGRAETRQAEGRPGGQQRSRQGGRSRSRGGRGSAPLVTQQFTLFCFDRGTGKELWKQVAVESKPHQATHSTNNFASASPCTDGQHLYAHFGSRGLFCYSMDGELKWKREDLGKMETRLGFGEGSSPTIAGDKIIVPWDHEGQSALFALDKNYGKTLWKTERDEPTCWATPLVVEHNGTQQIVMNGQNMARAYDLETGDELWRCGGQTDRPVASAVAADGLIFVGSGHRGSFLAAFRPDGRGNVEGTDSVVWSISRDTPDVASPLLSNGRLYFHKGRSGMLSCVDAATGKTHFGATRVPGLDSIYASPVAAGGHVYLTDRRGTTVVIKDSPTFEIVATNSVGETVDATPAPVDDELFIRGEQHLFCISGS